jgi:hypothetical protein
VPDGPALWTRRPGGVAYWSTTTYSIRGCSVREHCCGCAFHLIHIRFYYEGAISAALAFVSKQ